jgi:Ran GTPase-activating protein (RanGAP) involved in mRNA processing and transport
MATVEAAKAAEAAEATSDAHILSNGLIGALYVARCRDAGVEPTPNGARRFQSEVVGLTEEWARNSLRAAEEGLAHAVHLPNLRLGLRSAQVLSRGLLKPSALQLHSNAGLGDVGASTLLTLLEHGSCKLLDLGACGLGPSFAPTLARYLLKTAAAGAALEHLELGGATHSSLQKPNQLRGLAALAAVLQQRSPKLKVLGLSHCGIGTAAESASCALALAALAAHAPGLATLDIAANGFGRAAGPLLQLLPVYPALTELDASGNELSDWGAEAIATALLATSASRNDLFSYVRTLPGAAGQIAGAVLSNSRARAALRGRTCQLRALALSDNRIQVGGARALALAIGSCASIRSLTLSDNPLSDAGVAAIAAALAPLAPPPADEGARPESAPSRWAGPAATGVADGCAPPSPPSALATLDLCGCGIGVEGAHALSRVLEGGQLSALRLGRNHLTESGLQALAQALPAAASLQLLDLSGCRVTDRAALQLVAAVVRSPHGALKTLKLHDNLLSDKCGLAMHRLLAPAGAPEVFKPPAPPAPAALMSMGVRSSSSSNARGGSAVPSAAAAAAAADAATEGVSAHAIAEAAARLEATASAGVLRGRGALHSLTVHGNQLSFTTCALLRGACATSRQTHALPPEVNARLLELSSNVPAMQLVQHQLGAERVAADALLAEVERLEAALHALRTAAATEAAAAAAAHDDASAEADAALAQIESMEATLAAEEALYQAERTSLDAEVAALLQRKAQLEALDKGSPRRRSALAGGEAQAAEVQSLDVPLMALRAEQAQRQGEIYEQEQREKRAIAEARWIDEQLGMLDASERAARNKARPPAKPPAKPMAPPKKR